MNIETELKEILLKSYCHQRGDGKTGYNVYEHDIQEVLDVINAQKHHWLKALKCFLTDHKWYKTERSAIIVGEYTVTIRCKRCAARGWTFMDHAKEEVTRVL